MPERYGALMDKMEWANALAELWTLVNKANKYIFKYFIFQKLRIQQINIRDFVGL